MNESIQKMLNDLYALDPSLKAEESKLVAIVENLLAAKPDTKFDAAFAARLKQELLAREMPEKATPMWKQFFSNRLNFALVGVVAAVLVIVTLPRANTLKQTGSTRQLADNAFGSLLAMNGGLGGGGQRGSAALSADAPLGSPATRSSIAPSLAPMPTDAVVSEKMIVRPFFNYKLQYAGDPLELTDANVTVFRRVKGSSNGSLTGSLQATVSGIDLGSFGGAGVTNLDLAQETSDGYVINLNFLEGTININQNWRTWPMVSNPSQLTASDLPSDEAIIGTANAFLQYHGIAISDFDTPRVNKDWQRYYPVPLEAGAATTVQYVPDQITVLYPLKVNDQIVYDMSGNPSGLQVTVDIRQNRVTNVWQVQTHTYESSNYAAETDAQKIISIAENGGMYGGYGSFSEADGTKTVKLGTPTKILIFMNQYLNNGSNDLYVPALSFPVLDAPEGFYQKNIIVPLAKELLDNNNSPIRYLEKGIDMVAPAPAIAPVQK